MGTPFYLFLPRASLLTAVSPPANVAVTVFPIEVLPILYRYGYAVPFYNISKIARTVVFGTKNEGTAVLGTGIQE